MGHSLRFGHQPLSLSFIVKDGSSINLKLANFETFGPDLHMKVISNISDSYSSHFAGVGTRNYYRKLGYELDGPYMSKELC